MKKKIIDTELNNVEGKKLESFWFEYDPVCKDKGLGEFLDKCNGTFHLDERTMTFVIELESGEAISCWDYSAAFPHDNNA